MVLYIAKCGCRLKKEETKRKCYINEKGKHNARLVCIEHQDVVLHRETVCSCGEVLTSTMYGTARKMCDPCTKEMLRKKALVYAAKKRENKPKRKPKNAYFSINRRGDYCKFVAACFAYVNKNKMVMRNWCRSCAGFSPIFKGVDPARMIGSR